MVCSLSSDQKKANYNHIQLLLHSQQMGKGYETEQYTVFVRSCGSRNLPALLAGVLTALAVKDKLIILVVRYTHP